MTDHSDPTTNKQDALKKPYAAPQLTEYGSIEKLTQTGSLSIGDAAMQMMACL